jgi:hypothetical protein
MWKQGKQRGMVTGEGCKEGNEHQGYGRDIETGKAGFRVLEENEAKAVHECTRR